MAGISGIFMFFVALSIHYNININGTLALLSIIIGLIATSRLYLNAHNFMAFISMELPFNIASEENIGFNE